MLQVQRELQNVPDESLPLPKMHGIGPPAACLYGPFSHAMTAEEALVAEQSKRQTSRFQRGATSRSARQKEARMCRGGQGNQPSEDDAVSDLSSDDGTPGIRRLVSTRSVNSQW
jgi:hypothetical protein